MTQPTAELTNQWNDFLLRQVDPYATAKYEILLDWTGDLRGKTVLIVGSGSGELAALMAGQGAQVTAIDISPEYVELTRQTAKRFNVEIETAVARLENFRPGKNYDFVAATDVLEHIEDDRLAIAQLRELLSPEGKLVITVPALPQLFGYHDEILGHFRRYTASSLRSLVEGSFRVSRLRHYGAMLIPVAFIFSRLLRKPYPVRTFAAAGNPASFYGKGVRAVFRWEKLFSPPLGTSLILIAQPRAAQGAPDFR